MGNRSLMDRTPDSDSGNAGSIPARVHFFDRYGRADCSAIEYWRIFEQARDCQIGTSVPADVHTDDAVVQRMTNCLGKVRWRINGEFQFESYRES